ncbi:MAG: glycoside hydrolase family 25 protein [Oscillospiraceae bacterium]|nr:glycoside hydrolase family 25 protein [Oscillospiraceae bacterium]
MKNIGKMITVILVTIAVLVGIFYPSVEEEPNEEVTFPTIQRIPKHDYLQENFYWDEPFLRYKDREHLVGVDVSTHQEEIDWEAVANSGVDFAILRAGFRGATAGDLYEDDCFAYNLKHAKAAGLKIGVYFFSQALNEEEAVEEARYVCDLLDGEKLQLPVFFDWEYLEGRVPQPGEVPLTECAVAFCEAVIEEGYEAGVYFNQDYGYNYFDIRELKDYTLWLADYGNVPGFLYLYHCVQYTDNGRVPGIDGPVDLDLLFIDD